MYAAHMLRQPWISKLFLMSISASSESSSPSKRRVLSSVYVIKNSLYFVFSSSKESSAESNGSSRGMLTLDPFSDIYSECSPTDDVFSDSSVDSLVGSAYYIHLKREMALSQKSRAQQYLPLLYLLLPFSLSCSYAMNREQHSRDLTLLQSQPLKKRECWRQIGYLSKSYRWIVGWGSPLLGLEKSSFAVDRQYLNFETKGSQKPCSLDFKSGFFFLSEVPLMKGHPPLGFSSSESESTQGETALPVTGHFMAQEVCWGCLWAKGHWAGLFQAERGEEAEERWAG